MSTVVALTSLKGGCGKTTSTAHLAMCKHLAGASVVCIDIDDEAGLAELHGIGDLPFDVVTSTSQNLKNEVKRLSSSYDYVFIDIPANNESLVLKSAALADGCIVPCNATVQDVLRLNATLDAISTIEDARDQALTSVLLTRVKKGTNIADEVKQALAEKDVPLCDTMIHDSVRYQVSTPRYLEEYQAVVKELGI